jgi:hypothetical protein
MTKNIKFRRNPMMAPLRVHGTVTVKEPEKPKPLPNEEALQNLVSLFDFSVMADNIDAGIKAGVYKGHPIPPRCTKPVAGGHVCGLATRKADGNVCAFHNAVHNFSGLRLRANDIYAGTPVEADIRARHAALKPKVK